MMKLLLTAFALAGILSAPALIRSAPTASPNEVMVGGKRIGQDPDANQFGLRPDAGKGY